MRIEMLGFGFAVTVILMPDSRINYIQMKHSRSVKKKKIREFMKLIEIERMKNCRDILSWRITRFYFKIVCYNLL